ncbi:MAG: DNA-3-methyladenine glycosylase I [Lactobacillales bacterium]|jgi:DNA-3-methyladenine glycosylase I|nr:DNA-3-methyladenine glycosylase I [Lactobacillales bacterium]
MSRCAWAKSPVTIAYHDAHWGKPVFDDVALFKALMLEIQSSGLSFELILKKQSTLEKAYDNFIPEKLIRFDENRIARILQDPGAIRHEKKIRAMVDNARAYLNLKASRLPFSKFLWDYVGGKPIQNNWTDIKQVPSKTLLSDQITKELKKRGFKFVGSTTVYAFMQATGMVNDHAANCPYKLR